MSSVDNGVHDSSPSKTVATPNLILRGMPGAFSEQALSSE